MEQIGSSLKGIYHDRLVRADGQVTCDSGWVSNTIVDSCRVRLATFMGSNFISTDSPLRHLQISYHAGQEESQTPTSQLELTATLAPGYPKAEPVPLLELGL